MAFAAGLEASQGALAKRGRDEIVEHQRPVLVARYGHLHPRTDAARRARRAGKAIDVGNDLARDRHFDGRAFGAKHVLHVDHDEHGLCRIDVLEAEAAVKQLQLRTLIGVRDVLTPEQLGKAKKLGPPKMAAAKGTSESAVMAKANQLRAAVEALGVPPTEAMKTRGAEIEALIKSGELGAADLALDKLMEDSHFKELEAEAEVVDFSKFETGSADLESLRQRFEAVQEAGREVLSLPLLRQMIQAKKTFEEAKEAQNAELVGRILTYVEGKLKK